MADSIASEHKSKLHFPDSLTLLSEEAVTSLSDYPIAVYQLLPGELALGPKIRDYATIRTDLSSLSLQAPLVIGQICIIKVFLSSYTVQTVICETTSFRLSVKENSITRVEEVISSDPARFRPRALAMPTGTALACLDNGHLIAFVCTEHVFILKQATREIQGWAYGTFTSAVFMPVGTETRLFLGTATGVVTLPVYQMRQDFSSKLTPVLLSGESILDLSVEPVQGILAVTTPTAVLVYSQGIDLSPKEWAGAVTSCKLSVQHFCVLTEGQAYSIPLTTPEGSLPLSLENTLGCTSAFSNRLVRTDSLMALSSGYELFLFRAPGEQLLHVSREQGEVRLYSVSGVDLTLLDSISVSTQNLIVRFCTGILFIINDLTVNVYHVTSTIDLVDSITQLSSTVQTEISYTSFCTPDLQYAVLCARLVTGASPDIGVGTITYNLRLGTVDYAWRTGLSRLHLPQDDPSVGMAAISIIGGYDYLYFKTEDKTLVGTLKNRPFNARFVMTTFSRASLQTPVDTVASKELIHALEYCIHPEGLSASTLLAVTEQDQVIAVQVLARHAKQYMCSRRKLILEDIIGTEGFLQNSEFSIAFSEGLALIAAVNYSQKQTRVFILSTYYTHIRLLDSFYLSLGSATTKVDYSLVGGVILEQQKADLLSANTVKVIDLGSLVFTPPTESILQLEAGSAAFLRTETRLLVEAFEHTCIEERVEARGCSNFVISKCADLDGGQISYRKGDYNYRISLRRGGDCGDPY